MADRSRSAVERITTFETLSLTFVVGTSTAVPEILSVFTGIMLGGLLVRIELLRDDYKERF